MGKKKIAYDDSDLISKRPLKVGEYEPNIQKKGYCEMESCEKLKEGEVFWTICLEDGSYYDTKSQDAAEIMSRLVRIERKMKKK